MMKKAIWVVGMVLLGVGAAWGGVISEDPGELTASGLYWIPGSGDFDLFSATHGVELAKRVHACLGRALSKFVIDAAHLDASQQN